MAGFGGNIRKPQSTLRQQMAAADGGYTRPNTIIRGYDMQGQPTKTPWYPSSPPAEKSALPYTPPQSNPGQSPQFGGGNQFGDLMALLQRLFSGGGFR